jgi:hypothetical protein
MRRFLEFVRDSAWTWGGGIIVLVTLSGSTRLVCLWITGVAFLLNTLTFLITGDDE